jgi:hypothetical protein
MPTTQPPKRRRTPDGDLSAQAAISEAQRIAFAPMLFHAVAAMRDLGILASLDAAGSTGATAAQVAERCHLSLYGTEVLLEMGVSGRLLLNRDNTFFLGRAGRFLLHDAMTRVNFDFIRDVCYAGMARLGESVATGKPAGLREFGNWPTIYPGLSALPEPAKTSWFAFDHFYSDAAFSAALPVVFQLHPGRIYDVGGNTGKWALRCVAHDANVRVTVLDLPEQVALLEKHVAGKPGASRIEAEAVDILGETPLPAEADVWWMSQFLDCFSAEQIVRILKRIRATMKPGARVCILEPFCERQSFEAGTFSLNAGSLYFTCMANGTSRFYRADVFAGLVAQAGLVIEREVDKLGTGEHTLLVCAAAPK